MTLIKKLKYQVSIKIINLYLFRDESIITIIFSFISSPADWVLLPDHDLLVNVRRNILLCNGVCEFIPPCGERACSGL